MNNPMPKDNEVDEKVIYRAVAWFTDGHEHDKSATTWDPTVAARWESKGWPVWGLHKANDVSVLEAKLAYSSATVAELRAEVASERKLRLRAEGLCSQWITRHDFALESLNELTADRNAQRDRADAAERRVGELEAVLRRISTMNAADDSDYGFNEWGEADCFNQVRVLAAEALTGADPT